MADPIEFPSATAAFSLPLLFSGQTQKEFFINQSLALIDSLLQAGVVESLNTPPSDPAEGASYRVTGGAVGDWDGEADAIAVRIAGAWQFIDPFAGMTVFDRAQGQMLTYQGEWRAASEPLMPQGGAVIDAEARVAISGLTDALRDVGILP